MNSQTNGVTSASNRGLPGTSALQSCADPNGPLSSMTEAKRPLQFPPLRQTSLNSKDQLEELKDMHSENDRKNVPGTLLRHHSPSYNHPYYTGASGGLLSKPTSTDVTTSSNGTLATANNAPLIFDMSKKFKGKGGDGPVVGDENKRMAGKVKEGVQKKGSMKVGD